jgi:hypothetical protein
MIFGKDNPKLFIQNKNWIQSQIINTNKILFYPFPKIAIKYHILKNHTRYYDCFFCIY